MRDFPTPKTYKCWVLIRKGGRERVRERERESERERERKRTIATQIKVNEYV